jgi:hypothetical protein
MNNKVTQVYAPFDGWDERFKQLQEGGKAERAAF